LEDDTPRVGEAVKRELIVRRDTRLGLKYVLATVFATLCFIAPSGISALEAEATDPRPDVAEYARRHSVSLSVAVERFD